LHGAVENRIDSEINNLTILKVNTEAVKTTIQEADFASETSKMTRSQIYLRLTLRRKTY